MFRHIRLFEQCMPKLWSACLEPARLVDAKTRVRLGHVPCGHVYLRAGKLRHHLLSHHRGRASPKEWTLGRGWPPKIHFSSVAKLEVSTEEKSDSPR